LDSSRNSGIRGAGISRLSKTTKGEQAGTLGNPQSTSFETDLKFEENRYGKSAQRPRKPLTLTPGHPAKRFNIRIRKNQGSHS